jgi:Protein of unknown function (DUF2690)
VADHIYQLKEALMRPGRHVIRLLLASMLAAAAIVPLASAPASAASCYASSCTFQDPIAMGCAGDAITIYKITGVGVTGKAVLELRYSPGCAAAWAKVYNDISFSNDVAWVTSTQGYTITQPVDTWNGAAYTDMVDDFGSIASKACIGHSGSNSSTCTGWY